MKDSAAWTAFVNTRAGGVHPRDIDRWRRKLRAVDIPLIPTCELDDFRRYARESYDEGCRHFFIIGGDGTFHRSVNALYELDLPFDELTLAFLPRGSGNDWSNFHGLHSRLSHFLEQIKSKNTFTAPLGLLTFPEQGRSHVFLNIAGIGFDAFVVDRAERGGRKGPVSYLRHVIASLRKYQSRQLTWKVREDSQSGDVFSMHVGMGRTAGGGMAVLPHTGLSPGELKVTIIHKASAGRYLRSIPRLLTGRLGGLNFVDLKAVPGIHIASDAPTGVECDGEGLGQLPCAITLHDVPMRVLDTRRPGGRQNR